MQPTSILDLCCGAGGAAYGLHQIFPNAKITGIDHRPQKHYPYTFVKADALEYASSHLHEYDYIWASPPCQLFSVASYLWNERIENQYVSLIEPIRDLLIQSNKPYTIENVIGTPLIDPIMLCGTMFDLLVYRHRLFESNFPMTQPIHEKHTQVVKHGDYSRYASKPGRIITVAGHMFSTKVGRKAMGIPWKMNRDELAQAVPPAYAQYIATQLLLH